MIVGKFASADGVYTGSIPAISASSAPVRIAPSKKKGVDYDVLLGEGGIELGVAWKKTSAKGNAYLSVKLDSPVLPEPANCALLNDSTGVSFRNAIFQPREEFMIVGKFASTDGVYTGSIPAISASSAPVRKQDDGSHALVWKRAAADAKGDEAPPEEAAAA